MALPLRAALRSAGRFVVQNPSAMFNMARHALGMRIAVPLDAVRWFIASTPPSKKAPQDVTVLARPPAIAVGATIDLMGTTVRASASIKVEQLDVGPEHLKVKIRLANIDLKVLGEAATPVAALIKSGALDLSKPGNVVKFLPKKPPAIVEAEDDRIVLDLMKVPKIAANKALRKALSVIAPVLGVGAIETDDDHLYVKLKATPAGLGEALGALRR